MDWVRMIVYGLIGAILYGIFCVGLFVVVAAIGIALES